MQREIYNLLADNKPLPKGTRIKTTQGGVHTGGDHELSEDLIKSANRMVNGYVPFWVLSWRDLHADLIIPGESCSPCDSAFARFHEERRKALLEYIEKRVARHVKSGGNDSPSYRKDCAYDGMRDLPGHGDRDIWSASWTACLENTHAQPPDRAG